MDRLSKKYIQNLLFKVLISPHKKMYISYLGISWSQTRKNILRLIMKILKNMKKRQFAYLQILMLF